MYRDLTVTVAVSVPKLCKTFIQKDTLDRRQSVGTATVPVTVQYGALRYATLRYGALRYATLRYGALRYGHFNARFTVYLLVFVSQ